MKAAPATILAATLGLLAGLASLAQAGAASPVPATPKDTPIFAAPAGWTSQPVAMAMSGFTMLGIWKAPTALSAGDNLGLGFVVSPPGTTLPDAVQALDASYTKMFGAGNPVASHAERVCGGSSDGWYFENNLTFGALNVISEQTVVIGPSDMFVATYTRMTSEKEDAAARSALDTLCVKPSASPA